MRCFWPLLALACVADESDYLYEDLRIVQDVLQVFEGGNKTSLRHICNSEWTANRVKCVRVQDRWRVRSLELQGSELLQVRPSTISASLCKLTWLQELQVNTVKGPLPDCIGELKMLRSLTISTQCENDTSAYTLPASIGNLAQLRKLQLWSCGLTGSIPRAFWSLPWLTFVSVIRQKDSVPMMTADLPEEVGQLSHLEFLRLQNIKITSPLPASLGLLPQLRDLDLENTQMPQPLPASLGLLRSLRSLSLKQNNLKELPASWASAATLRRLALTQNDLKELPLSFAPLQLESLNIDDAMTGCVRHCSQLRHQRTCQGLFSAMESEPRCVDDGSRSALVQVLQSLWGTSYDRYRDEQPNCPCFWEGVSCNHTDRGVRVLGISLRSEELRGELPPELSHLPDLEFLDLRGQLGGLIPESIGQLKKLKLLDLTGNALAGPIPSSILQMEGLEMLLLAENQLSGSLASPIVMPELRVMNISNNQLSGAVPTATAQLPKLRSLNLRRNLFALQPLPEVWDGMANLWELVLSGNQFFSSLPSTFPTLTQLRVLDISETGVRGSAPKRMEQMSQLVVFDIHGTRIERGKFRHTYPDTTVTSMGGDGKNCAPMLEDPCCLFGRSSNRCTLEEILRRLWTPPYWQRHAYPADTPFCSWSGVTCATVEGRPRVVKLILEDALMSGMLNGHWEDLGELRELRVRSRRTTGGLQWGMGSMSKLEILELQGPFDGALWGNSWIGELTSLRVLILRTVFRDAKRQNKDRLPATIAHLRNLEVLDLTGNRVRMQFQSLVGSLPKLNLRELRLSGNLLEGSIGKEVSDLPNLEVLALDGNILESKLPGELAQLSRLQELDLRNNRFEGKVPRGLRRLKLTRLALGNNQFTTPIQSKNCAPVEEDPCELFRLQDLDRGDVNVWPFILVTSLLLSGLFYKDRTCQGFSVRPGALELAAWSSDGEEWEGRRKFRNCWAVLEVCELCFVIAMPLAPLPLSFPLLSQIALLTLVLFKLALFRLHRKELVFRPLDVLLPEGSSVLMLPSQEMAGHAKLLGIIVCGYLATFLVLSKMHNVFMVMEPFCCLVFLLAMIRTTFASRTVPFEEQREDKANELHKVALVVEVFTSDRRWHRINERTVHVDFQLPSSSQRSFAEVELQSSTSSCTPPAEAATKPQEDPEGALHWDASRGKIPVSVTVGRKFSVGGPTSLTMKWTDPQERHSHEVWLLEMGPCVFDGGGGVMYDVALVLLTLVLSLVALCYFSGPGWLWMSVSLLAAIFRLVLWNARTWIRLPQEIATSVQQGYFSDGVMRMRSDAFGVVAPILALACSCAATSSPWFGFIVPVPIALTALQLRIQERRAGFT